MGSCQLHPPQHGVSSTRFIWSVQEWLFLKNKYLISSLYDKLEQVVDKLRSDQRTFLKESHRTIKINLVHARPMSRRLPLAISFQLAQVLYCSAKGFVVCKTIFFYFSCTMAPFNWQRLSPARPSQRTSSQARKRSGGFCFRRFSRKSPCITRIKVKAAARERRHL